MFNPPPLYFLLAYISLWGFPLDQRASTIIMGQGSLNQPCMSPEPKIKKPRSFYTELKESAF